METNIKSTSSWINIEPANGKNNGTSEITIKANNGRQDRSANIIAEVFGGTTDILPINQTGRPEYIIVDKKEYIAENIKCDIEIIGKSNCPNLVLSLGDIIIQDAIYKLKINDIDENSWDGINNTIITGDPGLTNEYNFKLIVSLNSNETEISKIDKFEIKNIDSTVTSNIITINQNAGVKIYSDINIIRFDYDKVPASGGIATPNLEYSQTWGWNNSFTGGGVITSGASLLYSGTKVNNKTGEISVESKGTEESDETIIDEVTLNISLNGKTNNINYTVIQEENIAIYGDISININDVIELKSEGDEYDLNSEIKKNFVQLISYTSGDTRNGKILSTTYSINTPQTGFSLNDENGIIIVEYNPTTSERNGFIVNANVQGEGIDKKNEELILKNLTITFNQNGDIFIKATPDPLEFNSYQNIKIIQIITNSKENWTIS